MNKPKTLLGTVTIILFSLYFLYKFGYFIGTFLANIGI